MAKQKDNPVSGLNRFEGKDVLAATIKVTRAGDGLSEALSVDPTEYHKDDVVYVVLKTSVGKVTFEGMPKVAGALQRVHVLVTETAAIIDGQVVATALAETERKLAEKREREEEAKGTLKIPGTRLVDESSAATDDPDGGFE